MLSIPDAPFGPTLTRRRWLQLGGLGALGLSLPRLLQARRRPANPAGAVVRAVPPARRAEPTRHLGHEAGRPGRGARRVPPGGHQRSRRADHRMPAAPRSAGPPLQHRPVDDALGRQPQRGDVFRHDRQPAAARADRLHADRERFPPPRRASGFRPAARRGTAPTAVSLPDPVGDGPYLCPGQNGGFLGAVLRAAHRPRRSQRRRLHRRRPARDRRRAAHGESPGAPAGASITAWAGWPTTAGSRTWAATSSRRSRC